MDEGRGERFVRRQCACVRARVRKRERERVWEGVDAELLCGTPDCGACINEKRGKGHRTKQVKTDCNNQ